jgi:two-component system chemotaxis response regulator CheY
VTEVLVVDDSRVMREMVKACLRPHADIEVTQAASGLEAIEALSMKRYDLVVLDLNMPDIGGIEVLEFVRSQDQPDTAPIIMVVSTRDDDSSRAAALAAGASSYMTKPFTPEAILAEVRTLLTAARART